MVITKQKKPFHNEDCQSSLKTIFYLDCNNAILTVNRFTLAVSSISFKQGCPTQGPVRPSRDQQSCGEHSAWRASWIVFLQDHTYGEALKGFFDTLHWKSVSASFATTIGRNHRQDWCASTTKTSSSTNAAKNISAAAEV